MENNFSINKVMEYNDDQMIDIIIKNTASMMTVRRYFLHLNEKDVLDSFIKNKKQNLNSIETHYKNEEDSIYVLISLQNIKSIDKNEEIRELLNKPNNKNTKKILIVQKITPKAIKQVEEQINLEYELASYMTVDPTKNIMNSKFILLSQEEQDKFLKEFSIDDTEKMSVIFKNDRMAKYYDLKENEIVMVHRPSINSCYSYNFRICKKSI